MTGKEKYLSNILQQLEAFLKKDWPSNLWLENAAIKVYVRQSERHISVLSDETFKCLDIANIYIKQIYRQKGLFTDFMNKAHEIHHFDMTYIECIRNPIVLSWCVKRGWKPHSLCGKDPADCFYLPKHGTVLDKVTITSLEASLLSESIESVLLAREKHPDDKSLGNVSTVYLHLVLHKLQTLASRHSEYPDAIVLQEL